MALQGGEIADENFLSDGAESVPSESDVSDSDGENSPSSPPVKYARTDCDDVQVPTENNERDKVGGDESVAGGNANLLVVNHTDRLLIQFCS